MLKSVQFGSTRTSAVKLNNTPRQKNKSVNFGTNLLVQMKEIKSKKSQDFLKTGVDDFLNKKFGDDYCVKSCIINLPNFKKGLNTVFVFFKDKNKTFDEFKDEFKNTNATELAKKVTQKNIIEIDNKYIGTSDSCEWSQISFKLKDTKLLNIIKDNL